LGRAGQPDAAPCALPVLGIVSSQDPEAVAWLRRQPFDRRHEYRVVDSTRAVGATGEPSGWTARDTADATVDWFTRTWSTVLSR
jgi:hypothetical protein